MLIEYYFLQVFQRRDILDFEIQTKMIDIS